MRKLAYSFDTKDVTNERILDAVCEKYGYAENIPDPDAESGPLATIPNPLTKDDFVKKVLEDVLASAVLESDRRAAIATAERSVTKITFS